ncbi:MAG TPA: alpha/beta hydrolase [Casimicrobiaceae bacterium]|nr:alpha/beta hydrolase [Casimicrobiaceae bacterium]
MLTRTQPRVRHFRGLAPHGFHRVAYYEWGDPANDRVVVCVHGVGRNGRDFDVVAEALAPHRRVVAIDMPGRGHSEWLADPNDYVFPTYLATLTALIAACRVEQVDWIGTSMGGLLGMVMAAQRSTPVRRLVLNDVGPVIEPGAVARIAEYFGKAPTFATYEQVKAYVREISAPFGPLDEDQWDHVVRTNVRELPDGRWSVGYDPGIAIPFRTQAVPPDLWPIYDAIRAPTLLLRGGRSDLLSRGTAEAMTERGPRARLTEFDEVGHAPMLMARNQVDAVMQFLLEGD